MQALIRACIHVSTGALNRLLSDASGAHGSAVPTLRHMDTLRQIMRDAAGDPGERRIARIMVEGLDDNLNRLQPRDIVAGNGRQDLRHCVKGGSSGNACARARRSTICLRMLATRPGRITPRPACIPP